jgi:hypothetical protein
MSALVCLVVVGALAGLGAGARLQVDAMRRLNRQLIITDLV